jgi:hypothetical protein
MIQLGSVVVLYWALTAVILIFAALVVINIVRGKIDLSNLLSEAADGKASLSRFQFLIFTFVIAGLYLTLSLEVGNLIDVPNGVLMLLGISGGGYVISKGISASSTGHPPAQRPGAREKADSK